MYNKNGDVMKYKITINQEKCIGCEKCIQMCKNSVLRKINGKVFVLNEHNCDVLGECIQACPMNAISLEPKLKEVCIGDDCMTSISELYNWPVQLMGVSCDNKYLEDADLLIAATCSAYAYANFHEDFIRDHVVLITCLKNDLKHHVLEKCKNLFEKVNFNSVSVVTVNSPCCLDLVEVVKEAMELSGKEYNIYEKIIRTDGEAIG